VLKKNDESLASRKHYGTNRLVTVDGGDKCLIRLRLSFHFVILTITAASDRMLLPTILVSWWKILPHWWWWKSYREKARLGWHGIGYPKRIIDQQCMYALFCMLLLTSLSSKSEK
jgi:hypothetical protein